jgi:hypothetical protein
MDTRESGRKQETREEVADTALDALSSSMDHEELLQKMQISTKHTLDHLDKLIQSSNARSNKRAYLELFRALIEESAKSSESIIYLFEYAIDLRASILLLWAEVEKSKGKTVKDLKKLKSKLDSLLNSPAMTEIGRVLRNIRKITEERKNAIDENPEKGYLR